MHIQNNFAAAAMLRLKLTTRALPRVYTIVDNLLGFCGPSQSRQILEKVGFFRKLRPAARSHIFRLFRKVSERSKQQRADQRIERKEVESSSSGRRVATHHPSGFWAPTVIGVMGAPGGENFAPPTTIARSYNPGGCTHPGQRGDKTLDECAKEFITAGAPSMGTLVKSNQMGLKKALSVVDWLPRKISLSMVATVVEDLLCCEPSASTKLGTTKWRHNIHVVKSTHLRKPPESGRSSGVRPSVSWLNSKGSPTPPPKEGELPWLYVVNREIDNNISLQCICSSRRYISKGLREKKEEE